MTYLINNQELDLEDHGTLQRAHAAKVRPICTCVPGGVPVVIVQLGDEYYLKRFPETGYRHAPFCVHYEPPSEISGKGELLGEAIIRNEADNSTTLKVNFSLSKGSSAPRATANSAPPETIKAASKKLTLKSFFEFLWEEAELNEWSPKIKGQRNYKKMRELLLDAAAGKFIKGEKLGDVLYVPEFYVPEQKDGIKLRREIVFSRIAGSKKYMIAVGELKAIHPSSYGVRLVFKHLPDTGVIPP